MLLHVSFEDRGRRSEVAVVYPWLSHVYWTFGFTCCVSWIDRLRNLPEDGELWHLGPWLVHCWHHRWRKLRVINHDVSGRTDDRSHPWVPVPLTGAHFIWTEEVEEPPSALPSFFNFSVQHFCVGVVISPHLQSLPFSFFFFQPAEFETKAKYTGSFIRPGLGEERTERDDH